MENLIQRPLNHRPVLAVALALIALSVHCVTSSAQGVAPRQRISAIHATIENYLKRETRGLPGSASYSIGALDPNLNLAACPAMQAFAPPGARPWGNTTVGVRCAGEHPWTIYVPVAISVKSTYLALARSVPQGHVLGDEDLALLQGDLGQLPAGTLTDPKLAVGKTVAVGITAGQPVRQDMLRNPMLVTQGQTVRLVSQGRGFRVTAEARAITNAREGQTVQTRTASGQLVSGIVRPGPIVEVQF